MSRLRAALLAVVALAPSCDGVIGDQPVPGAALPDIPGQLPVFQAAAPTLHRLTLVEYRNTLTDLLPDRVMIPTDLEVDTPLYGFTTIGASELTITPRAAEQYEAAAMGVADQVFGDDALRTDFVGCTPGSTSDPCIRAFLTRFGKRAWRRPLEPAEIDQLAALATTIGDSFRDPWQGVKFATASLLQSPYFLFRVEIGEPDPRSAGKRRFTTWEMASRLSYLLLRSTPDDALLAAAERGDLVTKEGIERETTRLLATERARSAVGRFFVEYLALERLDGLTKNTTAFPEAMSPTLGASMRGELENMFDDVVFTRDGDFREILTTQTTFMNTELARLYGVSVPSATETTFARVTLPAGGPRGGLLTSAGILALYAHNTLTSPTLRGKFIRVNLLCQDIPPPPPGVRTDIESTLPADGPFTMRERLEAHRTNPTCASCHVMMDPLGLGLEHFDAIGRYRETDNGLEIDASGDVDGTPFADARELGEVLGQSPEVGACIARRLYRYGNGHVEAEAEERAVVGLADSFEAAGFSLKSLLMAFVVSDGFRLTGEVE